MATVNRFVMRSIIKYLDRAMLETILANPRPAVESDATWNIRMARESLLEAAVADVAVEMEAA